ncbi:hypothetical protein NBRC116584_11140 [Hydrogenophaga sp. 5NK40-0174]
MREDGRDERHHDHPAPDAQQAGEKTSEKAEHSQLNKQKRFEGHWEGEREKKKERGGRKPECLKRTAFGVCCMSCALKALVVAPEAREANADGTADEPQRYPSTWKNV